MPSGVAWTVSVLIAIVANLALASILAWRIRWHSHDLLFQATSARNPSVTGMFPPGRRMMDALPQCEKWSGEDGLAGKILQAEIRLAQRRLAVRTQAARLAHDLRRRLPQALTLLAAATVGVAAARFIRGSTQRPRPALAEAASPGMAAGLAALMWGWLRTSLISFAAAIWRDHWHRPDPVDPLALP